MQRNNQNASRYGGICLLYRIALCAVVMIVLLSQFAHAQTALPEQRSILQQTFRSHLGRYDRTSVTGYLAYTQLRYGHEWCASFVSYCFGKIGQAEPKTPWSPALFPQEKRVWHNSLQAPKPTAIAVGMVWGIYIPGKGRIGHVGFVDDYRQGIVHTIEGNTSDPNGQKPNGVYRKRRHWRTLRSIADWIQISPKNNTILSDF